MTDRVPKQATSIRLSPTGKRLLERLAEAMGVSQAAVLEIAIREYARGRIRPDDDDERKQSE